MSLKPGSLNFVLFYAAVGAVLGFGSSWLMSNASVLANLLAEAGQLIQVAASWQ